MKDNYTDIFDNIDINALTIDRARKIYDVNFLSHKKDSIGNYVKTCLTYLDALKTYTGKDVFNNDSSLYVRDTYRSCYKEFLVSLNRAFLDLGLCDSSKDIEDFFEKELICLDTTSKRMFDGIHMKLSDIKYHKTKFDKSEEIDYVEWFFIYRAFYMLREFFKVNS